MMKKFVFETLESEEFMNSKIYEIEVTLLYLLVFYFGYLVLKTMLKKFILKHNIVLANIFGWIIVFFISYFYVFGFEKEPFRFLFSFILGNLSIMFISLVFQIHYDRIFWKNLVER